MQKEKVIIANMSGFYGDRFTAAKEMIEGGPINFLTGDYLAELTMLILAKSKMKKPELGYAVTFLKQMEGIMGLCLDKGIKVVVNAGGLNPIGLADALRGVAKTLQLHPKIASIQGDNLMPRMKDLTVQGATLNHLDTGANFLDSGRTAVSANAYLGCWGIVSALDKGADIVVTGRVADTSLVMGPAAHYYNWRQTDWDALAGAATAGHIIECGGQAVGGNYSFFEEVPSFDNVGFPIAEIARDGSSIITKHDGTGGVINIGTVTAQLLYEINQPAYITPDVVAHFDTIQLKEIGKDQVEVSGVKGTPATDSAKVTINAIDSFQNQMIFYLAGLNNERKAEILKNQFLKSVGGEQTFDHICFQYIPTNKDNPQSNEEAFATLKVVVEDKNPSKAGRLFTSKIIELALCSVPGFCIQSAPQSAKPKVVHFPALIGKQHITQQISMGEEQWEIKEIAYDTSDLQLTKNFSLPNFTFDRNDTKEIYLGELYAARSGDKGGNANLGVYAKNLKAYAFLRSYLTVDKFKELLADSVDYEIERYDFPNLLGLNFYLKGFLGDGVAGNNKIDPQAKTLGEYLRAKKIEVPVSLLT